MRGEKDKYGMRKMWAEEAWKGSFADQTNPAGTQIGFCLRKLPAAFKPLKIPAPCA
jgi:hypothetical protein